ncbi:MAG: serine--tRNA ligase [candidate division Zixibacteria bacterium]|nr:serine--tRNA ligase [candidate division Zixibacteria bacterium]
MLDIKFIRENPDRVKKACADKNDKADIDLLLALDAKRRALTTETEALRAKQNQASEEIARLKKSGGDAANAIAEMKAVAQKVGEMTGFIREVEEQLQQALLRVPNVPHESVPVGPTEEHNVTVREWGQKPAFDFKPAPHWELGEKLDILDLPRGTKIAGSGYFVLKGAGAKLERALISFMLDYHVEKFGFTEILPPFLARAAVMTGTGQLPKLAEDMYRLADEELYLIPTAEVPVTNLHREEVLKENDLPIKYVAYTPCFRREAGAAGKDTRGILRVHQFDKVEMVKIVTPETSYAELESLVTQAEGILQLLDIPYRVRMLATGDLSFAAAKCYDLELWAAGVDKYLEVSSVSNFEDFQARRMNCRYRGADGKMHFPHTLNGSGLALPRLVVALMENYQTRNGEIIIPEALRPYMGGRERIA